MGKIENKNNFLLKILRILLIGTPSLLTLIYVPGFMFSGNFPKTIFLYIAVSIILAIWLIHIYRSGAVVFKKNWINKAVLVYILILFISALAGGHFEYSFFGAFSRMNGIVTVLYISFWYLIASSVLRPRDWTNVFRALLFSGFILAIISFLGINGFNLKAFSFLDQGGSLFSNNTFSGIYYLFVFFFGAILFIKDSSRKWRTAYALAMFIILINPDIFNFQVWQNPGLLKEIFNNPFLALGTARASALTMGVGIIVAIVMYLIHRTERISIKTKSILFGAILLGMLLASVGFVWSAVSQKGAGYEFLNSQNDFQRPIVWNYGVEAFKNKPLFGYGPNGFEYAFQDSLTPDISFLKGGKWLDKTHNGWLDPLVETGILGILGMVAIFIVACWFSFKYYLRTNDFSVVVVVLLLVLHIVQIQTSFNTNTSLFMVFILLAYITSSSSEDASIVISRYKNALFCFGFSIVLVSIIFTAIKPSIYNYRIISAIESGKFEKRMQMYQSLHSFYGYPPEVIRAVVESYTNYIFLNENFNDSNKEYVKKQAMIEYNAMLDLYEAHYNEYDDNFRYIINYVNTIYIARFFDIDRMDRAGELITRAKELSVNAPQVFWLAALHAKYTGNEELALQEISRAVEMAESSRAKFEKTKPLDDFYYVSLDLFDFLEKTKNSKKKSYFFLKRI